jgi:hypothetical protein
MEKMDVTDEKDQAIRTKTIAAWLARPGVRVGDFVKMLDGTLRRFTHDWGDDIQTTSYKVSGGDGDASFYVGAGGFASYSGGLDPAISKDRLVETGETRFGNFWFFHHGFSGAGRGRIFEMPCRVYEQR